MIDYQECINDLRKRYDEVEKRFEEWFLNVKYTWENGILEDVYAKRESINKSFTLCEKSLKNKKEDVDLLDELYRKIFDYGKLVDKLESELGKKPDYKSCINDLQKMYEDEEKKFKKWLIGVEYFANDEVLKKFNTQRKSILDSFSLCQKSLEDKKEDIDLICELKRKILEYRELNDRHRSEAKEYPNYENCMANLYEMYDAEEKRFGEWFLNVKNSWKLEFLDDLKAQKKSILSSFSLCEKSIEDKKQDIDLFDELYQKIANYQAMIDKLESDIKRKPTYKSCIEVMHKKYDSEETRLEELDRRAKIVSLTEMYYDINVQRESILKSFDLCEKSLEDKKEDMVLLDELKSKINKYQAMNDRFENKICEKLNDKFKNSFDGFLLSYAVLSGQMKKVKALLSNKEISKYLKEKYQMDNTKELNALRLSISDSLDLLLFISDIEERMKAENFIDTYEKLITLSLSQIKKDKKLFTLNQKDMLEEALKRWKLNLDKYQKLSEKISSIIKNE